MYDYNQKDLPNIDLAYTYTENFLKERRNESTNLKSRLETFLGFAGLLLRFNIDLPSTQPSYLGTKIIALITSFCAIVILVWALKPSMGGEIVHPSSFIEDKLLKEKNADIKLHIIQKNTELSEVFYLSTTKQKDLLDCAINFLVASAFFFTLNGLLVSYIGK